VEEEETEGVDDALWRAESPDELLDAVLLLLAVPVELVVSLELAVPLELVEAVVVTLRPGAVAATSAVNPAVAAAAPEIVHRRVREIRRRVRSRCCAAAERSLGMSQSLASACKNAVRGR
jgi:hypothetical protein